MRVGLRKATLWIGALVLGVTMTGTAQAGFIAGASGTTHPKDPLVGPTSEGYVNVAVYSKEVGGGYGTGNAAFDTALAGVANGANGIGVNSFLYLYQTVNLAP